jgi:long-chain acyl-CoA synthetase
MADVLAAGRWRSELEVPALALGDLPVRAAERWPDRTALVCGDRSMTYAELADATARAAAAIAALAAPGAVVGVGTVLDPSFAVAYYGAARAGCPVVTLNPMIRAEGLTRILAHSRTQVALLTREMADRIAPARAELPLLTTVVVLDAAAGEAPEGTVALADLLASAGEDATAPQREFDPAGPACLHFTSGTTGTPKAVRLSHRGLVVNAAQTAQGQGLTEASVTLNQLPLFHIMHLNSAVWAGATQVLCTDRDPAAAVATADEHGSTHWFSISVLLARLAADPRLPGFKPRTVRGIFCGGSALQERVARTLSESFGFPVVQGYGLAEASPTVTLDVPERSKPGSCGPALGGTEIRIVDLETRQELPAGQRGEIQIRGPQLMIGYAGRDPRETFEADGFFSTGDVGHLDEDGYLFIADRLDDVFKCDHEIVAPAEVEEVLARHPDVADCVVFGHPDEVSGAVAHALIVLREGAAGTAREAADAVSAELAGFQRIAHADAVTAIPRSPNGKVQRRQLREQVLGG